MKKKTSSKKVLRNPKAKPKPSVLQRLARLEQRVKATEKVRLEIFNILKELKGWCEEETEKLGGKSDV